jgi:hypothetical protein
MSTEGEKCLELVLLDDSNYVSWCISVLNNIEPFNSYLLSIVDSNICPSNITRANLSEGERKCLKLNAQAICLLTQSLSPNIEALILKEQEEYLIGKIEELKALHEGHKKLKHSHTSLIGKHENLEKKFACATNVSSCVDTLDKENANLKTQLEVLTSKHVKLQKDHEVLKCSHDNLQDEHAML